MNSNHLLLFTAGKPKKEDALKSILLMLGPDFITDIIEVLEIVSKLLAWLHANQFSGKIV